MYLHVFIRVFLDHGGLIDWINLAVHRYLTKAVVQIPVSIIAFLSALLGLVYPIVPPTTVLLRWRSGTHTRTHTLTHARTHAHTHLLENATVLGE